MKWCIKFGAFSLLLLNISTYQKMCAEQQFCHDLETGEFRPVREGDKPTPMKPHNTRSEFNEPHLSCSPPSHEEKSER